MAGGPQASNLGITNQDSWNPHLRLTTSTYDVELYKILLSNTEYSTSIRFNLAISEACGLETLPGASADADPLVDTVDRWASKQNLCVPKPPPRPPTFICWW
jgi:hypothetical protein